eukprot:jgi/Botrbrau1/17948/Bobra.50_1s0043.1
MSCGICAAGAALYEEVKRQADSRLGIISQCLVISKFTKAVSYLEPCFCMICEGDDSR